MDHETRKDERGAVAAFRDAMNARIDAWLERHAGFMAWLDRYAWVMALVLVGVFLFTYPG